MPRNDIWPVAVGLWLLANAMAVFQESIANNRALYLTTPLRKRFYTFLQGDKTKTDEVVSNGS